MVGTLPGRTQGLGLITEPLLRDLGVSRVAYAQINLVATLVGALFCLGIGRLIDRAGQPRRADGHRARARARRAGDEPGELASWPAGGRDVDARVRSERAVDRQPGDGRQVVPPPADMAMAIYALAMSIGFMVAFPLVGALVLSAGWRVAWAASASALCSSFWRRSRGCSIDRRPRAIGARSGRRARCTVGRESARSSLAGWTLARRCASPAFWVFALASSAYGLVASGIGLFNESILAERGFHAGHVLHRHSPSRLSRVWSETSPPARWRTADRCEQCSWPRWWSWRPALAGLAARNDRRARHDAGRRDGRRAAAS